MADMTGSGVVRNIADMRGAGVVCNERCGCPSPCPGGISCRCYNQSQATTGGGGEVEHKRCSCGEHCGCNPCTACDKSVTAGAGCRCGPGCSCTSCP